MSATKRRIVKNEKRERREGKKREAVPAILPVVEEEGSREVEVEEEGEREVDEVEVEEVVGGVVGAEELVQISILVKDTEEMLTAEGPV